MSGYSIAYEDEHLLVVDKGPGLTSNQVVERVRRAVRSRHGGRRQAAEHAA